MASRSLNKVQLLGNLTRDPELRYTPQGAAVCTFGLATNRSWTTEGGEKKEETEFHRLVAWNKLAEICSQFLTKGRRIYIEGRLQTRQWNAQDGTPRQSTEIVISEMIILDGRRGAADETTTSGEPVEEFTAEVNETAEPAEKAEPHKDKTDKETKAKKEAAKPEEKDAPAEEEQSQEVSEDDIPF